MGWDSHTKGSVKAMRLSYEQHASLSESHVALSHKIQKYKIQKCI